MLLALLYYAGKAAKGLALGILVDDRNRDSLHARFNSVCGTVTILSLCVSVFTAKFIAQADLPGFTIPDQVLGLLGISVGSTVIAVGVKAQKDATRPAFISASKDKPSLAQMFLVEEGPSADESVDITKIEPNHHGYAGLGILSAYYNTYSSHESLPS